MSLLKLMPPLNPNRCSNRNGRVRLGLSVAIEPTPREGGWGGEQWHEATGDTAVGGRCARCGRLVRAIDLRLRKDREGEDVWKCIDCTYETPKKARTVKSSRGW